MRISDWSSDVCSSDLTRQACRMDFAPCRNRASLHRGPIRLTTQPATCMPTSRSCLAQVRHTHRSPRSIGCLSEGEGHPYAHSLRSSVRSEEQTSELQSLMRIQYAVFCLKKKQTTTIIN